MGLGTEGKKWGQRLGGQGGLGDDSTRIQADPSPVANCGPVEATVDDWEGWGWWRFLPTCLEWGFKPGWGGVFHCPTLSQFRNSYGHRVYSCFVER